MESILTSIKKMLGIQGFGNIGQLIAKKAVALGMDVVIYTDEVKEKHQRWKATFSLKHLYSSCDFISVNIHVPRPKT